MVLIVDDHAGFRQLARALLEPEGVEVVGEAATGRDALAMSTSPRPDLAACASIRAVAGVRSAAGGPLRIS